MEEPFKIKAHSVLFWGPKLSESWDSTVPVLSELCSRMLVMSAEKSFETYSTRPRDKTHKQLKEEMHTLIMLIFVKNGDDMVGHQMHHILQKLQS